MKVLVLGHNGMLGSKVARLVKENGHQLCVTGERLEFLEPHNFRHVEVVINCAGAIPQKEKSILDMIYTNAIGPHVLAEYFKGPIIHISTDCVFNGFNHVGRYNVYDVPLPVTCYGQTKLMGEVKRDNIINVRTSFIGREHGLLAWLLAQENGAVIQGWVKSLWSGSTVQDVAQGLMQFLHITGEGNTVHLGLVQPVSKYWLLRTLVQYFGLNVTVEPCTVATPSRPLNVTHPIELSLDSLYD